MLGRRARIGIPENYPGSSIPPRAAGASLPRTLAENVMADKILVIEDEPTIADNITYALETDGFEAIWASTASDGLRKFEQGGIGLILLDVGLPDMNGFDLCRKIRLKSNLPIIFLTARAGEVDRVVGLEIGGDDYVVKPFSPREVCARVRAVLRRFAAGGEKRTDEYAADGRPLRIDEARRTVIYREQSLDLSRYEYRILKILAGHPGRVYSRDELMNLAWDEPEASFDRTIDAHIKTLRAKLRAVDPATDPIRTHRGMGYSLKENL